MPQFLTSALCATLSLSVWQGDSWQLPLHSIGMALFRCSGRWHLYKIAGDEKAEEVAYLLLLPQMTARPFPSCVLTVPDAELQHWANGGCWSRQIQAGLLPSQRTNIHTDKQPRSVTTADLLFNEPQIPLSLLFLSLEGTPGSLPCPLPMGIPPQPELSWDSEGWWLPEGQWPTGKHGTHPTGLDVGAGKAQGWWPDPNTSPDHKAHHGDEAGQDRNPTCRLGSGSDPGPCLAMAGLWREEWAKAGPCGPGFPRA